MLEYDEVLPDSPLDDVDGVVMPGIVNAHVHSLTRADGVTTIAVASRSAAE